jgi:hypothetical protein
MRDWPEILGRGRDRDFRKTACFPRKKADPLRTRRGCTELDGIDEALDAIAVAARRIGLIGGSD